MDANDLSAHAPMLEYAERALGGIDVVLIAHGTLPDQRACEASADTALAEIKTNALSIVSLLTLVANRMAQQKSGTIAVISSVAGDRGRSSNYVYGSAKALVSTFLSGLRQRLSHCGVGVVTIKPGFVDTPMTREFRKGFLWAQPSQVARGIVAAIDRQKPVVYLPSFWRLIMFIVRLVPERVFLRMKM
jgi:short-subunit dehydrogenase